MQIAGGILIIARFFVGFALVVVGSLLRNCETRRARAHFRGGSGRWSAWRSPRSAPG